MVCINKQETRALRVPVGSATNQIVWNDVDPIRSQLTSTVITRTCAEAAICLLKSSRNFIKFMKIGFSSHFVMLEHFLHLKTMDQERLSFGEYDYTNNLIIFHGFWLKMIKFMSQFTVHS